MPEMSKNRKKAYAQLAELQNKRLESDIAITDPYWTFLQQVRTTDGNKGWTEPDSNAPTGPVKTTQQILDEMKANEGPR
jgi:hypothetical protein